MTPEEADRIFDQVDTWRRRAIIEGVVGTALLFVAVICAERGEAWHLLPVALLAGGTLSAAFFTYVRGRQWMRVAAKRAQPEPAHWPSPLASKGEG